MAKDVIPDDRGDSRKTRTGILTEEEDSNDTNGLTAAGILLPSSRRGSSEERARIVDEGENSSEERTRIPHLLPVLYFLFLLFIILAPWSNIPALLILHVTTCISLLIHWLTHSQACSLVMLEAAITDSKHDDTFTHKLIKPIYSIDNHIIYFITFLLMCVSIYKLYSNRHKFSEAYHLCMQVSTNPQLIDKLLSIIHCYIPVFFDMS